MSEHAAVARWRAETNRSRIAQFDGKINHKKQHEGCTVVTAAERRTRGRRGRRAAGPSGSAVEPQAAATRGRSAGAVAAYCNRLVVIRMHPKASYLPLSVAVTAAAALTGSKERSPGAPAAPCGKDAQP